jgi:hypothetical protein
LFGSKARGDRALIDHSRDAIDEGEDPEEPGPAQPDEPAEPQHDCTLPLLRHSRRAAQDEAGREDRQRQHGRVRRLPFEGRERHRRQQHCDADKIGAGHGQ